MQNTKWATFTYFGTETGAITRLLKNTNVKLPLEHPTQTKTT
jgi:hypothetical protein